MTTFKARSTAIRTIVGLGLLWLLLTPGALQADEIMEQDVAAATETWLRHMIGAARPDAVVEWMEPHVFEGQTVGYIAHLVDGGYCLCGADDLVLPVYLYCPQGTYDPDNPSNRYILWEIGARLANLQTALEIDDPNMRRYEAALAERAALWKGLIARRNPEQRNGEDGRDAPDIVVLPVTSHWHLREPYWAQCPDLPPGSGNHVRVGCGATAMGQIMYYWQWPNTGTGSHSNDYHYRWRSDWDSAPCANEPNIPADEDWNDRLVWQAMGGGQLRMNGYWDESLYEVAQGFKGDPPDPEYLTALATMYDRLTAEVTQHEADFGATTYEWSLIEDVHEDPWDPGDDEVAKLCYHAGIAVDMNWGLRASGADTYRIPAALEDHFRYDPDTYCDTRDIDVMTAEIQWFRPLVMRGQDPAGGGHIWVVYGYDKSSDPETFMMNMGWGGNGDAWYSCDGVNPEGHHFNLGQIHVTNIAPENVVRFVDYGTGGGDGSPDNPYLGLSHALQYVPDYTTLVMQAGSTHTLTGAPVTLDRPMTLKGYDVTIGAAP